MNVDATMGENWGHEVSEEVGSDESAYAKTCVHQLCFPKILIRWVPGGH